MNTLIVVIALAAIMYAWGHSRGRQQGASQNIADSVLSLLSLKKN